MRGRFGEGFVISWMLLWLQYIVFSGFVESWIFKLFFLFDFFFSDCFEF